MPSSGLDPRTPPRPRPRRSRAAAPTLAALLAAGATFTPRPAAAQLEARAVVTDASGVRVGERRTYVSGTRVRVDDGERGVIVTGEGAGSIVALDHARRTYAEAPLAPAPASTALERTFEQIAMGRMAIAPGRAPLRVVRGKGKKTLLGTEAVEVQVYRGERRIAESWCAPARDASAIAEAVGAVLGPRLVARAFLRDEAALLALLAEGFPLVEKDLETGRTTTVVELRERTPPASVFAPPAGYRRVAGVAP